MEEYVVTKSGFEDMKKRLEYLKTEKRAEVIEKIAHAREFGDLSENAEYSAAKEAQSLMEQEISALEDKISNAIIVDETKFDGKTVMVGCFAKIYDVEFDEEVVYKIVGSTEIDLAKGYISNQSPVGKGLLGKKVGETVTIDIPTGKADFKVLEVSMQEIK